jgi:glycosyltransferase involved in cell wall biosynthesis
MACERPSLVVAERLALLSLPLDKSEHLPFIYVDRIDPASLAKGLLSVLSNMAELAQVAKHGRKFALRHHTWSRVAQDIESVLATIRKDRKARRE